MTPVFRVEALPALEGDALLISYGPSEEDLRWIAIDAGHASTGRRLARRLEELGVAAIELLVVTHVDADHIEGMLTFLEDVSGRIRIDEVWFNGWRHLREDLEGFGPAQGERLTTLIADLPWNEAFGGRAVRVGDDGLPPGPLLLNGGMRLHVLSPDRAKLARMAPVWEKACRDAGLMPGEGRGAKPSVPGLEQMGGDLEVLAATRTKEDAAPANGTSIAVLAEYAGRRALFAGDAHPGLLCASLNSVNGGARIGLDLFKLPHHGSQANVTRELLAALECRDFLFSTDGSKFNHPDPVAVARVITSRTDGTRLIFNYRQRNTTVWEERSAHERRHPFTCSFPEVEDGSTIMDLIPAPEAEKPGTDVPAGGG